ncbi:MAG: Hsp20/alpha crystallin family protein [Candidatus Hermodarchaeota archaeon]
MCNENPSGQHHHPHGRGMVGCFSFTPQQIHKMKRMAKHFMRGFFGSHIPYNMEDLGDSYLITVPLAGRTKEEVKVSLINKHLNIKAEKPRIPERETVKEEEKEEKEESHHDWHSPLFWKGFTFIDVNMDIPLPTDADTDTIVSKMANGLLKVTFGKKPPKKIDVSES